MSAPPRFRSDPRGLFGVQQAVRLPSGATTTEAEVVIIMAPVEFQSPRSPWSGLLERTGRAEYLDSLSSISVSEPAADEQQTYAEPGQTLAEVEPILGVFSPSLPPRERIFSIQISVNAAALPRRQPHVFIDPSDSE